jgi:ketosteroid isomerase-like protein
MSQENVDLVAQIFDAFNTGGAKATLSFYTPDVVQYAIPEWLEQPVYNGHDGALKVTAWTDKFDDVAFDAHELRDAHESVVALAELTGQIKGTRTPIRQRFGIVASDFRDGMVGEVRFYNSWQEALEAAGLAE